MVVPFPLPASVRCVVPHHLLCHDVIRPHPFVRNGRSRIPFSTLGNGVAFPHPSLVVIARLAVYLKNPWGRQHKQGNQLLLKIPGNSCFSCRACDVADIGMCVSGCLFRKLGCHGPRLKGVAREIKQEWYNKVLYKNHLRRPSCTTTSLLDVKKTNKVTQLCYHRWEAD